MFFGKICASTTKLSTLSTPASGAFIRCSPKNMFQAESLSLLSICFHKNRQQKQINFCPPEPDSYNKNSHHRAESCLEVLFTGVWFCRRSVFASAFIRGVCILFKSFLGPLAVINGRRRLRPGLMYLALFIMDVKGMPKFSYVGDHFRPERKIGDKHSVHYVAMYHIGGFDSFKLFLYHRKIGGKYAGADVNFSHSLCSPCMCLRLNWPQAPSMSAPVCLRNVAESPLLRSISINALALAAPQG